MSNTAVEHPVGALEAEAHARQLPEQRDLIAGVRSQPAEPLPGMLCDPNSGWPIQVRYRTSPAKLELALATADTVHRRGDWRKLPVEVRAARLERFAAEIEKRAARIAYAEAMNTGVVISVTRLFAGSLAGTVRDAIALMRDGWTLQKLSSPSEVRLHRLPWGPAVVIAPWNAPSGVAMGKIANALAAGCPVILKPSVWAPSSSNLLAEAAEAAEMPAGVFQLVHGDGAIGRTLTADPRVRAIAFTGSTPTGRSIAKAAAPNMTALQLELGGNNPTIVRADADVDEAARWLASGTAKLNGQWCEGPGRIFVHRSLHDELADRMAANLRHVRVGSSLEDDSEMGPISHEAHWRELQDTIDAFRENGARCRATAGLPPDLGGWFLSPTIITGASPESAQGEIFGPVVTLHAVDSDEEALALSNAPGSSLAGYVFSADEEAALTLGAEMDAGEIRVNGTSLLNLAPGATQSFWGDTGIGCHGSPELFQFFCGARVVGVEPPGLPF